MNSLQKVAFQVLSRAAAAEANAIREEIHRRADGKLHAVNPDSALGEDLVDWLVETELSLVGQRYGNGNRYE